MEKLRNIIFSLGFLEQEDNDNTFVNYQRGGEFAAWYCALDFCYTDQVRLHNTHVFDNAY